VNVFLDVDGVLLGCDRERPSRLALADHALDLLAFALARAEVYWLCPQGRGDARPVVDHLVQHTRASDRERLLALAATVRVANWRGLRTEALPADGNFVWLDDGPEPGELAILKGRGWLDRWVWVDTRESPDDLLRARQVLGKRLGVEAS
jgi:hypothetical protein